MSDTGCPLARSAAARDRSFDLALRHLIAAETARVLRKQARRHRLDAATAQYGRPRDL